MKKDISVIRESIKKIVALLTKRAIKVTQRGSRAYVQYNARNGNIELVNLPYLPDDASEEFIAAVQGFLDHEVGHVLFTDPKIAPVMKKESSHVKNLANAIEDVYIERRMSEAFSGSTGNLDAVRRFHMNRIAKPKIEEALLNGDIKAAQGYAGLVQFRAWGGQRIAQQFLEDNPKYQELVEPLAKAIGPELVAKIKKANSSWEVLDLARAIKKNLEEAAEKEESPPPESPKSKGEPASGKGEEGDEPETDTDDPDRDSEDEGEIRTETDDSGKDRGDEERKEAEGEGEPEAGDEEGGGKEGDRSEPESSEPESSDTGDDDGDMDGDLGDEEDDSEEEGEGPGAAAPDDEESKEDFEPTSSESSEDVKDDELDGLDKSDDLLKAFDEERDFDEETSEALSEFAAKEIEDADYRIFSTDWDVIEPAPKARLDSSIEKMIDRTQPMIASLQKGLERAVAAKARKTWNPGQRRGRIAPGALFKTAVGDERIFRTRYETQAKNTAVSLLVDCSGSMRWSGKIETAGLAAFALSSTLERLKINHEVIGFTSRVNGAMVSAMKSEGGGIRYARNQAIYMPVFKGFAERLTVESKSRMAHLTEEYCHSWLKENIDGESLRIAAHRLKTQRAERHVMIVLSDGSPACPGDYHQLSRHLKASAIELEASGVEVIGIGIMDNSVRNYYAKNVVLSNLDELPTTVMAELSKVLLAG